MQAIASIIAYCIIAIAGALLCAGLIMIFSILWRVLFRREPEREAPVPGTSKT